MVAKILAIDINKTDVSPISSKLTENYCHFLLSPSIEESLRIICTQYVDLVMITLPPQSTKLFEEFFAVLRQSCGMIPIIGITADTNVFELKNIEVDDVISINIDKKSLLRRINILMKRKSFFDEQLIGHLNVDLNRPKKIISFFCDDMSFLDLNMLKNPEVICLQKWPAFDEETEDADLFIINLNDEKAFECCAGLRLRKTNKYKPIVLLFDSNCKSRAEKAEESDIGYSDIIDVHTNKIVTACRLNSLIKYKIFCETLSQHLKKSLFMSAIDATTEVYNRSFFENYIENKSNDFGNFAILMIDIDKFKNINDKWGHAFADSMLKYISAMIKKQVRASDIIARYGGDEFIIVMKDVSKNIAHHVSERIQKQIEGTLFKGVHCTVSIGVCCTQVGESMSMKDAITIADKFMYIAKQNGGNAVKVCA